MASRPPQKTPETCHAASSLRADQTTPGSPSVFRSRDQGKSLSASAGQRKRQLAPESPLGRHGVQFPAIKPIEHVAEPRSSLHFSWGAAHAQDRDVPATTKNPASKSTIPGVSPSYVEADQNAMNEEERPKKSWNGGLGDNMLAGSPRERTRPAKAAAREADTRN